MQNGSLGSMVCSFGLFVVLFFISKSIENIFFSMDFYYLTFDFHLLKQQYDEKIIHFSIP